MTLDLGRASIPATVATPLCATMQHLDGRASESTHLIIPLVGTLQWTLTYNTNIFTLGAHTHGPIHLPLPPCLFSLLQKPVTREPPCGHVHEPVDRCNSMCWFSSAQCVVRGLGFPVCAAHLCPSCLARVQCCVRWSHSGLLGNLPDRMTWRIREIPAYNGHFLMHGHLMSHG